MSRRYWHMASNHSDSTPQIIAKLYQPNMIICLTSGKALNHLFILDDPYIYRKNYQTYPFTTANEMKSPSAFGFWWAYKRIPSETSLTLLGVAWNSISMLSLWSTFFNGRSSTKDTLLNCAILISCSESFISHLSPILSVVQKQVNVPSCSSHIPPPKQGLLWHGPDPSV